MASTSAKPDESLLRHRSNFWVYYEDTDFSGFVYHANYLKFFERAREHLIGIDYLKNLFQTGVHFVVSRADIAFKAPARHGDHLAIHTEATFGRSPVVMFSHKAYLIENNEVSRLLVTADITVVCLGSDNRPVRIPNEVLDYFEKRSKLSEFSSF